MVAHADDLRYFYAEHIGDTIEVTAANGVATEVPEPLEPGRYVLRVLAFGAATAVWVSQGAFGEVTATNAAPSMEFLASTLAADLNRPLITFMVRGGNARNPADDNSLSFYADGAAATVQITKVSRDKR